MILNKDLKICKQKLLFLMITHSFLQFVFYFIKDIFNLMDNKRIDIFEDVGDSEQSLQFNSFLQEIGFNKQRMSDQESQAQEHALGSMVASLTSQNKQDINAISNMVNNLSQVIEEDQYQNFSSQEVSNEEQSQLSFPQREKKIASIMMTYKRIQSGFSSLKAKVAKIGSSKLLKDICTLPEDEKYSNCIDSLQKSSRKTLQNAVSSQFGGSIFTSGFTPSNSSAYKPMQKKQILQRLQKKSTRIIRKNKKKIGPPAFETEEKIYHDLQGFQMNKETVDKKYYRYQFSQDIAKIHIVMQKKNWIAMQLAIFQAYKQDNQTTIQQSISFLSQVYSTEGFLKNISNSYSISAIRSYFQEHFKNGFIAFFKNSSTVLQKMIIRIIERFQQQPIEQIDIRLQILSHFFRHQSKFNEYRFKQNSKFEGPQLKYHLKMLKYRSNHLQRLRRCYEKHQHQIIYFNQGYNLQKIANAYAFLLRKSKLEKMSSQICFLVPNQNLIHYIKNQRKQLVKENSQMLEQIKRHSFSYFSRNIRKYQANKIAWTQENILAIINIFNSLIDNDEQVNSDQIKQITKKYGRTFDKNNELFKKYQEKITSSYNLSSQKIDQDKFKQMRRLLIQGSHTSFELIQRKIFLKQGIFISSKQIESNIGNQMQILIKQLLFDYMEKSLHQITSLSMRFPVAFVDMLQTAIPIYYQKCDLEQTIITTTVRYVRFYVAVSNRGEKVCDVYLQKKSLDLIFGQLSRQLGNIYIFAHRDKDFLSENWFQRAEVIRLYRKKKKIIPIPSFAEAINPFKRIFERIQQQVRSSAQSLSSLRIIAKKIVTQLEDFTIQCDLSQYFSKNHTLFGQLRDNHQKNFGVSRELQFQDMKLLISKQSVGQKEPQTIKFKSQIKKIDTFRSSIIPAKTVDILASSEKDYEQQRSLVEKISGIIRNISLNEKKKAIDTLKMDNERQMFLDQLANQSLVLKS